MNNNIGMYYNFTCLVFNYSYQFHTVESLWWFSMRTQCQCLMDLLIMHMHLSNSLRILVVFDAYTCMCMNVKLYSNIPQNNNLPSLDCGKTNPFLNRISFTLCIHHFWIQAMHWHYLSFSVLTKIAVSRFVLMLMYFNHWYCHIKEIRTQKSEWCVYMSLIVWT